MHRLHTDFGFTDTVPQWFSSYLTDRTHYVSLSNHWSAFDPVHSGVPQGSVKVIRHNRKNESRSSCFLLFISVYQWAIKWCSTIHSLCWNNIILWQNSIQQSIQYLTIQGPDSLHPFVLMSLCDIVCKPLAMIFLTSLDTMSLPNIWKTFNVSSIFK